MHIHATVRQERTNPGNRLIAGLFAVLKQRRGWQGVPAVLARARKEFDLGTLLLFFLQSAIAPLVRVPWVQEVAAGGCKYVLRKA